MPASIQSWKFRIFLKNLLLKCFGFSVTFSSGWRFCLLWNHSSLTRMRKKKQVNQLLEWPDAFCPRRNLTLQLNQGDSMLMISLWHTVNCPTSATSLSKWGGRRDMYSTQVHSTLGWVLDDQFYGPVSLLGLWLGCKESCGEILLEPGELPCGWPTGRKTTSHIVY